MRTLLVAISAAALGLAGCATSGAVGRCPPKAKVAAKAKAAAKPKPKAEPAKVAPASTLKVTVSETLGGHWPTFDAALARARAAHKPLLLEVSTSWCGPCKQFAKEFVPAPPVAFDLAQTVYVSYDAERGAGVDVAMRFGVTGYPTFILIDDTGKTVWWRLGSAWSPAAFADALDAGLARALTAKEVKALGARDPSGRGHLVAAAWARHRGRLADARKALRAAEAADPKGAAGVAPRAAQRLARMKTGAFLERKMVEAALRLIARYPGSAEARQDLVTLLQLRDPKAPRIERAARRVVAAAESHPLALNGLVYTLLGAGLDDVAVQAAKAQVKARPGDYNARDTLGEALSAVGQKAKATAASDQAIAMAHKAHVEPVTLRALAYDRTRFAKGGPYPDAAEFAAQGVQLKAALGRLDPDNLVDPAPNWQPMRQTAFSRALARRLEAAGRACAGNAASHQKVTLRLAFHGVGGRPAKVKVLTSGTSPALARCLEARVAQAKLPFVPGSHSPEAAIVFTRTITFGD